MLVKIKFPKRCSTDNEKREFVKELVEWGKENLNDQEDWEHKHLLLTSSRLLVTFKTESISFNIRDETDAMAFKIVWCES